jgi:inhibitor of KinA sporulation pathway (predicted exonuclease)
MPILNIEFDATLPAWPNAGLIAILDLEYTAWEGSAQRRWSEPWEWREIVQIGMVLVDAQTFAVQEGFEALVRPERNPLLSDYFVALTGITQERIEHEAVSFDEALHAVTPLGQVVECIIFNGYDGQILKENYAFHGATAPWPDSCMFNFRPLLADSLGRRSDELTSSELPTLAGIQVAGRCHSALHDCKAIAGAFAVWRNAGLI